MTSESRTDNPQQSSPLIDSHCHLDMLAPVKAGEGIAGILQEAAAQGVTHFLCVGVNLEDHPAMRDLCAPHANVFTSVGLHPCGSGGREPSVAELVQLANDPQNVAIGETGLDYFHDHTTPDVQQARFRVHIRAAREADKPVIVHTRMARADTLKILREEKAAEIGGVLHCFTEDWDTASAAMDLGFYVSFSGIVTFRNAADLRDIARRIPADRLLVETDSPYLAPVPQRGKENRPAWVRHVVECLATERGADAEELARLTSENFFRLFSQAISVGQKNTEQKATSQVVLKRREQR